ncbi:enoyl-CoA hydratase [Parafrankia colletiae]|uniref:Enoyl-CoA hydratase n=1 Tax=Parafrankia colletiae TaxID=573497 RepID=A0A1S1RLC5_9ACTN|nr:enoyl-CoA hydratase/isomerase family protein [Parafrankia colletiae]MCK9902417.1 enoyl-CoA hydratase/isomerase family protein [Frankia sp. Cpl3]OHV46195.1 enoyl-CoA hydratase [Parafrankia colletiae]
MSVPAAAASAAAAVGLVVEVAGPCISFTLRDGSTVGGSGARSGSPDLAAAMEDCLRGLPGDVRIVLVHDLHHLREHHDSGEFGRWSRVARRLSERADLLSVALLTGRTSGLGLALALACDLRVMADDAALCLADTRAGRVPALGTASALVGAVGYANALWLCLTGEPVTATEAARLGLAARVVPAHELDAEADRLATHLLAGPRDAATETKALLAGVAARSGPAAVRQREAETDALTRLLGTPARNAG